MSSSLCCFIWILIYHSNGLSRTANLTVVHPEVDGASVNNNVAEIYLNEWHFKAIVPDKFNLHLKLDKTWGFHSSLPSTITIDINDIYKRTSSNYTASTLITSFSVANSKYLSTLISLDNTMDNQIAPRCNNTPNLYHGNINALINNDGNSKWCKLIPHQFDCIGWEMLPRSLINIENQFPLKYILYNDPQQNISSITYQSKGLKQQCEFAESFGVNLGMDAYIGGNTQSDDEIYISAINVQYTDNLPLPTPVPTTSLIYNDPTLYPTNYPSIFPSNSPTIHNTNNPSILPSIGPTTQYLSNVPTNNNIIEVQETYIKNEHNQKSEETETTASLTAKILITIIGCFISGCLMAVIMRGKKINYVNQISSPKLSINELLPMPIDNNPIHLEIRQNINGTHNMNQQQDEEENDGIIITQITETPNDEMEQKYNDEGTTDEGTSSDGTGTATDQAMESSRHPTDTLMFADEYRQTDNISNDEKEIHYTQIDNTNTGGYVG